MYCAVRKTSRGVNQPPSQQVYKQSRSFNSCPCPPQPLPIPFPRSTVPDSSPWDASPSGTILSISFNSRYRCAALAPSRTATHSHPRKTPFRLWSPTFFAHSCIFATEELVPSFYLSVYLSIYLSVYPSIHLSIYPSIHPFIHSSTVYVVLKSAGLSTNHKIALPHFYSTLLHLRNSSVDAAYNDFPRTRQPRYFLPFECQEIPGLTIFASTFVLAVPGRLDGSSDEGSACSYSSP